MVSEVAGRGLGLAGIYREGHHHVMMKLSHNVNCCISLPRSLYTSASSSICVPSSWTLWWGMPHGWPGMHATERVR